MALRRPETAGARHTRTRVSAQSRLVPCSLRAQGVFRPHPLAYRRGGVRPVAGTTLRDGSLAEELQRAAVVITFNSNTAVESVLAGVPTITMDPGSMAWDMTSHAIDDPLVTPERERWAATLAWRQWTLAEIESGAALENLLTPARRVA